MTVKQIHPTTAACSRLLLLAAVLAVLAAAWAGPALAQPQPGEVFREYLWVPDTDDAGGALRVGGRLDYGGGAIPLSHAFDLEHAVKAEVVVEKLLCHDGTRGLALQVNDHDWIDVPEADGIPKPQCDYQHFTFPVAAVPLAHLKPGGGNQFRIRVSPDHPWNWPQNLIYGVHFRVYYDPAKKTHPRGKLLAPAPGSRIGVSVQLEAEAASPDGAACRVDFLGLYEDVNWEGDGQYRQWHYHHFRGRLVHHLGTVTDAPYRLTWDTSWVPDQPEPMQLAARITDPTGLTCFTEPVAGLTFNRPGLSVELCKPYDVPKKWVTRTGEKAEKFRVLGDPDRALAAQLAWSSWSPGYMNGIDVNGHRVFDQEGPRYAYYAHRVTLDDVSVLRSGENVLKTGLTPKRNGKMVHGMEVNWPGIMVLIQYREGVP